MKKVKQSRKGAKTCSYWMASWREGCKTRRRGERHEDGCRGGPPEGQEDEGKGAGDKVLVYILKHLLRILYKHQFKR
jgi:hypothetical protein